MRFLACSCWNLCWLICVYRHLTVLLNRSTFLWGHCKKKKWLHFDNVCNLDFNLIFVLFCAYVWAGFIVPVLLFIFHFTERVWSQLFLWPVSSADMTSFGVLGDIFLSFWICCMLNKLILVSSEFLWHPYGCYSPWLHQHICQNFLWTWQGDC